MNLGPVPEFVIKVNVMNQESGGSLRELFMDNALRTNLVVMVIIWSFCTFSFFVVPFYLETIPGNLFLMSTSTGIAEILASLICLTISHRFDS